MPNHPTPPDARPVPTTPAAPPACRLCLVGRPVLEAAADGRRIALRPKDAALLAVVVLSGPIAAERLTALLWPGAARKQADTSLRQRLFRLRRDTGAPLVATGALVERLPTLTTDLADTLAAIARDPQAGDAPLLGDLTFDDLPELADWLRTERDGWRRQRDAALADAAAQCERRGELATAIAYAQRLAHADPLAEHTQRRLMRLHYLRGDRAAAIAAFEQFEQTLKHELGTTPGAETVELLATIERAGAQLPALRAVAPASLMRPPHLIGRERELQAMQHAWAQRRVFLLVGEAGIGKTRLLHELGHAHGGVVAVQARPGDGGIAYALLARLLRAVRSRFELTLDAARAAELALVLPELGPAAALAGDAQRLRLHRAVEASLADALALGLGGVLVDDLHFADDASIDVLQSLVQADTLAALPWGLAQRPGNAAVAALAADAADAATRLRHALEEAGRIEAHVLQPLDLAQMHRLIESIGLPELDPARLTPALLRHSGGNPMFALETLKDLLMSGQGAAFEPGARLPQPATVGALIERRLTQLSAPALRLARVAALAGPDFGAELAAQVLEQHPIDIAEPWRELEAAQVLRDGAFAHDLIFEAARASVPEPIAKLLHGRIAHLLQDRGATPERLAPHWSGAGEWAAAGDAYAAAAQRAQRASQRTHEVEYWRLAAEAFERAGAVDRAFDARCESIPALIVVRGVTHANGVIDTLLAAAECAPQRAAALTARATAALMAADHATGIAAAVEAGTLCRGAVSPWPGFEAARLHAVGLAQAGRTAEALGVIEPLRALVEPDAPTERRGHFWADYAYVLNGARRLRDTAFALAQAIDCAQALGDLAELATLNSNLATVRGNLGQAGEALTLARRSLALQAQLGSTDGPEGAVVQTYVALYAGMTGRYDEALERLDAALDCFRRDGQAVWVAVASNHKAQCLLDLGQFARARQALNYEPPPMDSVRLRGATIAARLQHALGAPDTAALQQGLLALPAGADPHVRMHAMLDSVDAADADAVIARCDEVLLLAQRLEFAAVAMKARLLRAEACCRTPRVGEAAAAMRTLVGPLGEVQPADMTLGRAWWIAAQVFGAAGDNDQALVALGHGAHWVRSVALPHVPAPFRDSFLQRNEAHRALLAATDGWRWR